MTRPAPRAFDLSGKLAVVTGARRGIGLAIAEALAAAGADIVAVSARLERSGSEVANDTTAALGTGRWHTLALGFSGSTIAARQS